MKLLPHLAETKALVVYPRQCHFFCNSTIVSFQYQSKEIQTQTGQSLWNGINRWKVSTKADAETPNSSRVTFKCVCIMIPCQVAIYSLSSLLMDSHWIYQTIPTFACCIAPPRSGWNKMGQNTRNKNVFHVHLYWPAQVIPVQRVIGLHRSGLVQASPTEPTSVIRS